MGGGTRQAPVTRMLGPPTTSASCIDDLQLKTAQELNILNVSNANHQIEDPGFY